MRTAGTGRQVGLAVRKSTEAARKSRENSVGEGSGNAVSDDESQNGGGSRSLPEIVPGVVLNVKVLA
jgi:hypothetical protein